jgi:nucleoside-diphosphate-sugar epimerase
MQKEIVVAGAGWLGRPLALALKMNHNHVTVLSRSDEQSAFFNAQHISLIKLDYLDIEHSKINSEPNKILIICIPPVPDYSSIIKGLITTLAPSYIIFSSATSVYSQTTGEVTEESSLGGNPVLEEAEAVIINSGIPYCILRYGGLINEHRNPATHFSGKFNIPNGGAPVNLIHREDIIELIAQVIEKNAQGVFNVVYPSHPTRKEYYEKQCIQRGLLACGFTEDGTGKIVNGSKISTLLNRPYRFSIE